MQLSELAPVIRSDSAIKPSMRAELRRIFRETLGQAEADIDGLSKETKGELSRLQSSAEQIEAIFVRSLLKQMKLGEIGQGGPMGDFARDLSTQAIAEDLTQSGEGLGIARLVFASAAEKALRQMLATTNESQIEIKA